MRVGSHCYYVKNGEVKGGLVVELDTNNVYVGRYFLAVPKDRVFETRGEAQNYIDSHSGWWEWLCKKIGF